MKVFQFISPIVEYCESQFPKDCSSCGHSYSDFNDYVSTTEAIGSPKCYDDDLESSHPIGTLSQVNCKCGSTISLTCSDKTSDMYLQLVSTLQEDAKTEGITVDDVLTRLRDEIYKHLKAPQPARKTG